MNSRGRGPKSKKEENNLHRGHTQAPGRAPGLRGFWTEKSFLIFEFFFFNFKSDLPCCCLFLSLTRLSIGHCAIDSAAAAASVRLLHLLLLLPRRLFSAVAPADCTYCSCFCSRGPLVVLLRLRIPLGGAQRGDGDRLGGRRRGLGRGRGRRRGHGTRSRRGATQRRRGRWHGRRAAGPAREVPAAATRRRSATATARSSSAPSSSAVPSWHRGGKKI